MKTSKIWLGLMISAVALLAQAQDFKVDPVHSNVGFSVKHLLISNVKGHFGEFKGTWSYDPEKKELTALKGTVDVSSIDTNNKKRDDHLRNEDFFDVKQHPKATFEMAKFEDGKVFAKLTIRGLTRPVVLDTKISKVIDNPMDKGKTRVQGITMTGTINRLDYKIGTDYPNAVISEEVKLTVELEGRAPGK